MWSNYCIDPAYRRNMWRCSAMVHSRSVGIVTPMNAVLSAGGPAGACGGDHFRGLVNDATQVLPGVWDPLSAVLAVEAGFEAMFVSGFCVAGTTLGYADVGLLTQSEMAAVAQRICAVAPQACVIVDADTGYGDVVNVARTVSLWERAGAAGLFLEDQVWPKRCGHMAGKQVVDRDEWLSKLRAACATRSHLHVTARTDARAVLGLDEALERGRMARDLGVDAVFIEAPDSVAELERIADQLTGVTLVANMVEFGRTPLLSVDELTELGFGIVIAPVGGLLAATRAHQRVLEVLRSNGTLRDHLDELVQFDEFTHLVGIERVEGLRQRFGGEP
jgi:2-methylisocitrate lyase-like PEP mutase family enzyme